MFIKAVSEGIDQRFERKIVLEIKLMILEMFRIFDFSYIYLLGYIFECLRVFYMHENNVNGLVLLGYEKIFNSKSMDLFRSLCFKDVCVPDIYHEYNTNIYNGE